MTDIITPQLKDQVLAELTARFDGRTFDFHYQPVADALDCQPFLLRLIIDQFHDLGLIQRMCFGSSAAVSVLASAYDLQRRGGFAVQEEILKANIEKLSRELDLLASQLAPSLAQKASELSGIAANILTALSFFKP